MNNLREWFDALPQELLTELDENYPAYGSGLFDASYVRDMANLLSTGEYDVHGGEPAPGYRDLGLSVLCDSEGMIDGFQVEHYLVDHGVYMSKYLEWKHVTWDREAPAGRESAFAVCLALVDAYDRVWEVSELLRSAQGT